MRLPDSYIKTVVFLGPHTADGDIERQCTGFFVSMPAIDKGKIHIYLVTAKHYADKVQGKKIGIRVNEKSGKPHICHIPIAKWYYHPETPNDVDAAVLFADFPGELIDILDIAVLHQDKFVTQEILENAPIMPGDEITVIGLFTRLRGHMNVPIVRTGNIAAMPTEKVGIRIGSYIHQADVYLLEIRSMGGLSGSPVFVHETVSTNWVRSSGWKKGQTIQSLSHGEPYFLGLMHGHWNINPSEVNDAEFTATSENEKSIALGISIAVPAIKILEILNHPELQAARLSVTEKPNNQ